MRTKSRKQMHRKRRSTRRFRKQKGGEECLEKYKGKLEQLKQILNRSPPPLIPATFIRWLLEPDFDIHACSEKYFKELKEKLLNKPIQTERGMRSEKFSFIGDYLKLIFKDNTLDSAPQSFYDFFGFEKKRDCSVLELMEGEHKACTDESKAVVKGSCGEPSFFEDHRELSEDVKTKYLELLSTIETKLLDETEPRYFDLVIGSTTSPKSAFTDTKESYTLCITPTESFPNKLNDATIGKLGTLSSLKGEKHTINGSFPLAYARKPNNIAILDKITSMISKGITVRLTNKVCGSCFPAFYYLVKKGVEYRVSPEQGTNNSGANTPQIQACFKR